MGLKGKPAKGLAFQQGKRALKATKKSSVLSDMKTLVKPPPNGEGWCDLSYSSRTRAGVP